MKTTMVSAKNITKKWYVIDADSKTLGKVAAKAAHILKGKHKPNYTPHMDDGDNIIIINCEKVQVSGSKRFDKKYYHHTGFPGGLKETTFEELIVKKPEYLMKRTVKGMLPGNTLGRMQLKNLKCYKGAEHKHKAQTPQTLDV